MYTYTEKLPENGPVEVIEHLVHTLTAFPHVKIAQNLKRISVNTVSMTCFQWSLSSTDYSIPVELWHGQVMIDEVILHSA